MRPPKKKDPQAIVFAMAERRVRKRESVRAEARERNRKGICNRCHKKPTNEGPGATNWYCSACADAVRETARRGYYKRLGRPVPPRRSPKPKTSGETSSDNTTPEEHAN